MDFNKENNFQRPPSSRLSATTYTDFDDSFNANSITKQAQNLLQGVSSDDQQHHHVTAHQQESIFSLPQGQTETGSIEQVIIQPDGSIHGQKLSQDQVQ